MKKKNEDQDFDMNAPYLEGLTHRQKLFVLLYDGNATETAKRAGYKGRYNALAVAGCRLLKNAKVKAAISRRHSENGEQKTTILSREAKRKILAQIAQNQSNPGRLRIDAVNEDNRMMGEHKQTLEINAEISQLSDIQLRQRIQKAIAVIPPDELKTLLTPPQVEMISEILELEEGEGNKSMDNELRR